MTGNGGHGSTGGNGSDGGLRYDRALVIVAHPDDPEFLFGATVARLVEAGAEVRYVICSDGAQGSRDAEPSAVEISARRYAEQRAAAALLGVRDVVFLGHPDGSLAPGPALHRALVREIRRFRPELVITHFPRRALDIPIDASHPDHIVVGEAVLTAIFPDAANVRALPELAGEGLLPHRVKEVWLPGYEGSNHVVDATSVMPRKVAAIRCHESQMAGAPAGEAPPWVYWWMKRSGARGGYEYGEDFKRITL